MISAWQLLPFSSLSYLVILVFVALSCAAASFWRQQSTSQIQLVADVDERWLCRSLFAIKSEIFRIGPGDLVSAVCPVKKDWVFVKNCRTGQIGWLPQSCLELAKDSGAQIEKARLKVIFKDRHYPIDSPPKSIAEGIIWCILVFCPEREYNEIPDLGDFKSHIAIVVQSRNYRRITVGGPQRIDINDRIDGKLDHNAFLECFSYIHTRLHPQRLIVVINADECPLPALSGTWSRDGQADWISMESVAKLLERVHLRTPIALLILNSPRKANLCALHLLHQCCSVLLAAQEKQTATLLHPDAIGMLLCRPDISLENLISAFLVPFKMVAFNCDAYPRAAIVVKSLLNSIHSALYFMNDLEKRDFYCKLFLVRSCSNNVLLDEFVDIMRFCLAIKATVPSFHIFHELEQDLCSCIREMIITWKGNGSSGLWIHIASGLSGKTFVSGYGTYLPWLPNFYTFYDFLPRLQKRIAIIKHLDSRERSSFGGHQSPLTSRLNTFAST